MTCSSPFPLDVQTFFNKANTTVTCNSKNTMFIDQTIKIVKLLLESKIEGAAEQLAMTDIETLVNAFIDYLRQTGKEEDGLRTRIGLCNMLFSMMSRRQNLTFRHETLFRNSLVEKLIEFVSTDNAVCDVWCVFGG